MDSTKRGSGEKTRGSTTLTFSNNFRYIPGIYVYALSNHAPTWLSFSQIITQSSSFDGEIALNCEHSFSCYTHLSETMRYGAFAGASPEDDNDNNNKNDKKKEKNNTTSMYYFFPKRLPLGIPKLYTTRPPNACTLRLSSGLFGLWSLDIGAALPSEHKTARESPTFPTTMRRPRTKTVIAVDPVAHCSRLRELILPSPERFSSTAEHR